MAQSESTKTGRRTVRIFARDPALSGEVGVVRVEVPLRTDATHFDDAVVWVRRGGAVFPPQIEAAGEVQPIPHEGVAPSVVCDVFKAQMLFAVVHGTRDVFADALGRPMRWWKETPLMVRFDCREGGRDLLNAYYRRIPRGAGIEDDLGAVEESDVTAYVRNFGTVLRRARSATSLSETKAASLRDELTHVHAMGQDLIERMRERMESEWAEGIGGLVEPVRQLRNQVRLEAVRARKVGGVQWLQGVAGRALAWISPGRSPARSASLSRLRRAGAPVDSLPASAHTSLPAAARGTPGQELRFGIYASSPSDLDQGGALISTALMQDVAAHETVHALLDGLRPHLLLAPNAESMAFHEGFADIVAVFSRFANRQLVRDALERSHDLGDDLLVSVGTQFGFTATEAQRAARSAIIDDPEPWSGLPPEHRFDPLGAPHALGATLLSAIFAAFRVVYRDKSAQLSKLAGSSPPAHGIDLLAKSASDLGMQFLRLLIRAVDYLPPVDARFGDYLRALLTADAQDYPEDKWRYRERLVEQFRRYRIPVVVDAAEAVRRPSLHVSALLWESHPALSGDARFLDTAEGLWRDDPSVRSDAEEAIRTYIASDDAEVLRTACGLAASPEAMVGRVWSSARIVDGRRLVRERGLELIQHRTVKGAGRIYGGSTVLFSQVDGAWQPRFAIYRRMDSPVREEEQRRFLDACDRQLARAWRAQRDDEDRDAMVQRFTRHFHHAHCLGDKP